MQPTEHVKHDPAVKFKLYEFEHLVQNVLLEHSMQLLGQE